MRLLNVSILNIAFNGIYKCLKRKKLAAYLKENKLPNEFKYFDPTKALENRECGLHA